MTQKNHTKIQETLNMVVFSLQRVKNQRLTHENMAKLAGVSKRTFSEWMRNGGSAPVAMETILSLLSMLPHEDVLKIVEHWRRNEPSSANSNQDRGVANE